MINIYFVMKRNILNDALSVRTVTTAYLWTATSRPTVRIQKAIAKNIENHSRKSVVLQIYLSGWSKWTNTPNHPRSLPAPLIRWPPRRPSASTRPPSSQFIGARQGPRSRSTIAYLTGSLSPEEPAFSGQSHRMGSHRWVPLSATPMVPPATTYRRTSK